MVKPSKLRDMTDNKYNPSPGGCYVDVPGWMNNIERCDNFTNKGFPNMMSPPRTKVVNLNFF